MHSKARGTVASHLKFILVCLVLIFNVIGDTAARMVYAYLVPSVTGWQIRATFSGNEKQNQLTRIPPLLPLVPVNVFALNTVWFSALFASVVTGKCNCIGFGLTSLN